MPFEARRKISALHAAGIRREYQKRARYEAQCSAFFAFEVLAVVAYNQPVTKAYVEQVRGVDCSGVISTLCQKGLVEEKGRLDLPGRPLLYGTTPEFLKCFCIESLSELPELPEREEKEQETEKEEAKTFEVPAEEPAQPAQAEPEDGEDFDFDEFDVDADELENMYE